MKKENIRRRSRSSDSNGSSSGSDRKNKVKNKKIPFQAFHEEETENTF